VVATRAAHRRLGQGESRVAGHRPKDRHVPLARRHRQGRLLSGTPRPATHAAPNFRGGPAKGRRRLTDATHWRIGRLFHSASGATPVTRHSSQPNVMSTPPHGRLEVASASLESLPSIASYENNLCSRGRFAQHGTQFPACRAAGRSRDCRWEPVDFSLSLHEGAVQTHRPLSPIRHTPHRLDFLLLLCWQWHTSDPSTTWKSFWISICHCPFRPCQSRKKRLVEHSQAVTSRYSARGSRNPELAPSSIPCFDGDIHALQVREACHESSIGAVLVSGSTQAVSSSQRINSYHQPWRPTKSRCSPAVLSTVTPLPHADRHLDHGLASRRLLHAILTEVCKSKFLFPFCPVKALYMFVVTIAACNHDTSVWARLETTA
jgi:hypothetical protein